MERQQPQPAPAPKTAPTTTRIAAMQRLIDDRDETIRLLNEALSLALEELDRKAMAA